MDLHTNQVVISKVKWNAVLILSIQSKLNRELVCMYLYTNQVVISQVNWYALGTLYFIKIQKRIGMHGSIHKSGSNISGKSVWGGYD